MRAMILAAGFGSRLKPLTDTSPKPLVPLGNRPQIRHHLELLKAVGVREVMINLHHFSSAIPDALGDGALYHLDLHYSLEPEILGTGGGLKAASHFLSAPGDPFFVLNGDLLIELSLKDVLKTHLHSDAVATMVLREDTRAAAFGSIGVDQQNRIVDFVGRARAPGEIKKTGLFTGIHILEPLVFDHIPQGQSCINKTAYPSMIREGLRVQAHFQTGFWSDVGTPNRYLEANMALLDNRLRLPGPTAFQDAAYGVDDERAYGASAAVSGLKGATLTPPVLFGKNVTLESGCAVGPYVCVGDGVCIEGNARVEHSVLWPGTRISRGAHVKNTIVWLEQGSTRFLELKD